MAHKIYIGIDNGISGSIGIISDNGEPIYVPTPIKTEQSYTKTKQMISRVDCVRLRTLFSCFPCGDTFVALERPMLNPTRFKASVSALRSLEATLIMVEEFKFPYAYLDSKEWQKALLPSGLEGDDLKKASKDIGRRLFPNIDWVMFKDADGLLIAEYARRKGL
jgi:hypothetical protein